METKLEQIAAKAVKQRPKSVVREIRTPRSVGTGGGRPPPVTRCHHMDEPTVIARIADEVERKLGGESSGHDWWHIHRVWKMAEHIANNTSANPLVVQLAALLHDIADWKFHDGDEAVGPHVARSLLLRYSLPDEIIDAVCAIIPEVSFKGAGVASEPSTLEGKIVQDADRLDAI